MDGCETNMYRELKHWSDRLKGGIASVDILDRRGFLDAAADQVVTSVGVGHTANMKITEAIRRVNSSNWSKYDVDGKPIFDKHGKIAKGPSYEPPNLDGLF
jgi:hypothetical protein